MCYLTCQQYYPPCVSLNQTVLHLREPTCLSLLSPLTTCASRQSLIPTSAPVKKKTNTERERERERENFLANINFREKKKKKKRGQYQMRSVISRLIFSKQSIPRLNTMAVSGNGRYMTTDSTKVDEPFEVDKTSKVEEAETVDVPPPPTEKLLVLGGSGFVGSHVCREALDRGLTVASLSRSGRSTIRDSWANHITWHQGNLLLPDTLKEALSGATAVISCVGGFGSNSHMYKINGTANINAIRAAAEQGVKRFVYVSATDFGVANYLLKGYYEGKRAAETELLTKFPYSGVILRPGFIYGTRSVGSMKIPLGVIGSPLEMVLQHAKPMSQLPLVGPLFISPVNVTAVAQVAVRAATDPVFPPGIIDVPGIQRYSQQKSS
ncbi:hypothetical protein RGQ29_010243 [Quercus rubra]|uniref:NAD(P)-binding domain-containing protein n=2 Tax=Quercus rubra TaxID=3512 RepID=A0AAN7G2J3_QUERU|nr:hypothetical protein RGQ29_010243 [Quercus rubra]